MSEESVGELPWVCAVVEHSQSGVQRYMYLEGNQIQVTNIKKWTTFGYLTSRISHQGTEGVRYAFMNHADQMLEKAIVRRVVRI